MPSKPKKAEPSFAAQMMALLPSSEKGHAFWTPGEESKDPATGKVKVDYRDVKIPVSEFHWQQHLAGKRALVIGPVCNDGSAKFACLDADIPGVPIDVLTIRAASKAEGYPLYVRPSKSAAHVFAFLERPIGSNDAQLIAKGIAAKLDLFDYAKQFHAAIKKPFEYFPVPPSKDRPRGLNMPYLAALDDKSETVTGFVRPNMSSEEIPLDEFLRTVRYLSTEQVVDLMALGRNVRDGKKSAGKSASPAFGGAETETSEDDGRRFAEKKLAEFCEELRTMGTGNRNIRLSECALQLGAMVKSGWIERTNSAGDGAEDELKAAIAHWDDQDKTLDTLTRALDEGEKRPHFPLASGTAARAIAGLNERYATVRVGKDVLILTPGSKELFMKINAFHSDLANRFVEVNGEPKILSRLWMASPQRRSYDGIVFDPSQLEVPGMYNTWKGFPVEPSAEGSCKLFLDHVLQNIANGNENDFLWIMGFFADIVQRPAPRHPEKKPGTALAIQGEQGTGKSKIGEVMKRLLGEYHVTAYKMDQVVGKFNAHLKSCLLLQADEAFWAGNKDAEGVLKSMITDPVVYIEGKFADSFPIDNHMRVFTTSNNDWVAPVEKGDRRWAVFRASNAKKEDHAYFRAIDDEMANGGVAALMHYLKTFDLTRVNIRRVPDSQARFEQKTQTMRGLDGWWYEMLMEGELPWGCNPDLHPRTVPKDALHQHYLRWAKNRGAGERTRATKEALGKYLVEHAGADPDRRVNHSVLSKRGHAVPKPKGRVYTLGPLVECRDRFVRMVHHDVQWPKPQVEGQEDDWVISSIPEEEHI